MARFRRRSCSTFIGLVLLIFIVTVVLKSFTPEYSPFGSIFGPELFPNIKGPGKNAIQMLGNIDSVVPEALTKMIDIDSERVKNVEAALRQFPAPNYNIHAFYYTWYGNTQFDGKYIHWDHPLLPHWDSKVAAGYPRGRHSPPDDIGANFYPALGAYSSRDPSVIEAHMKQLRAGAIGKALMLVIHLI